MPGVAIEGLSASPLLTDPTWNGGGPPTVHEADYLTNDYTTNTVLMGDLTTH